MLRNGVASVVALVLPPLNLPPTIRAPELRLFVNTPATTDLVSFALSPDGENIVFVATYEGRPHIWLRRMDAAAARPLPETHFAQQPFWSPDSRSTGFFADGHLKLMDLDTNPPER